MWPLYAFLTAFTVLPVTAASIWSEMNWADQTDHKISEIPLIKAEAGPVKQRPLNRGGMPIPYQDMLVFGLLEFIPPPLPKVTLAPLPEEPIISPERFASAIEEPVPPDEQLSWVRDLKVGEIHKEFHRLRLAFLANRSSVAN